MNILKHATSCLEAFRGTLRLQESIEILVSSDFPVLVFKYLWQEAFNEMGKIFLCTYHRITNIIKHFIRDFDGQNKAFLLIQANVFRVPG